MLDGSLLRKEDIQELVTASQFKEPTQALLNSIIHSKWTNVVYDLIYNKVIMYYGLGALADIGIPWMVATPEVYQYQRSLLKDGKAMVAGMLQEYSVLMNVVDARNTKHIRWLNRMGFIFDEKNNIDIEGHTFLYFYKWREDV